MSEPEAALSQLCLIAHIVRGMPAFDVGQQIYIGDEVGWIIPTSGHRAYPYWSAPFEDVWIDTEHHPHEFNGLPVDEAAPVPPQDWPDHYSTSASSKGGLLTNLAAALGFKREEVKRRV